ncbi:peptide-N4-asparagine amidase [Streptomyces asoensis]|uniref:peptide-N4-asparagine amidase n=1 Tax=Streptomyces asoensis TaxID=249586 RepID=UPI0037B24B66
MRSRICMSMLTGAVLLASAVLGSGTVRAAPLASSPSPPTASASASSPSPGVPAEFGSDWHDPLTAAPPVTKPHAKSCRITLAEAQFRDFTPYRGSYVPPDGCGDHWSKVVLRLDGKVRGRQFDRLGHVQVGGVEIFRTSTPEPSPDGIEWSVEKDVTRYSATFRSAQDVEMLIGNVVDDTYTGVIDVKVTLTFYAGEAAGVPDRVLTLDRGPQGTTLTTPRNSERVVAEVYATGSGGGCEEYWYLTVPSAAPYSCRADDGPYREVQVEVDGRPAGIAAPFPTVWTGGWSNPFLWYVVPGPRAFDIKPIEYDLTPFAGMLNDGRAHRVEVSVVGVPEGQSGWSTPVDVLVWQDPGKAVVGGGLLTHDAGELTDSATYTPGAEHRVDTTGGHRLTVAGYLDTSHGRVRTTVTRTLANTSAHRWTDGESVDGLDASWTDDESVTVDGRRTSLTTHIRRTYTMNGTTTLGADDRLRTVLTLGDRADAVTRRDGRPVSWSRLDDTYAGDATFTVGVPRDQRHAVGTTSERYRSYGPDGCYDRRLATAQGVLTENRRRC